VDLVLTSTNILVGGLVLLCYTEYMSMIDNQSLYIILSVIALVVFSRAILRICLGLLLSVASITISLVSVVLCVVLIFAVGAPTCVLTCYLADSLTKGRGTDSKLIQQVCGLKPRRVVTEKY
jgi:hypothetical protein